MQINSPCATCSTSFIPDMKYFEIVPCGHRIHPGCIPKNKICGSCATSFKKIQIINPSAAAPTHEVGMKTLNPTLDKNALKEIDQLFNKYLDDLMKSVPSYHRGGFHITTGFSWMPSSGFLNGYNASWPCHLLAEMLTKLGLSDTERWCGPHDQAELANSADVSVLILNEDIEKIMLDSNGPRNSNHLWFFLAKRKYEVRSEDKTKASNTFVINLKNDPQTGLDHIFKEFNKYHLTNLQSLYAIHLKIAAQVLQCNKGYFEDILATFEYRCSEILKNNA